LAFTCFRDDEKTAFDWCKEGNISQLVRLLNDDPNVVHSVDEQVMKCAPVTQFGGVTK
jgi:hypothetical protein